MKPLTQGTQAPPQKILTGKEKRRLIRKFKRKLIKK